MGVTVLSATALLMSLVVNFLFISATNFDIISTNAPQTNRTSKELQEKSRLIDEPAIELITTGRKSSTDDYNTFSSLTSDVIIETSSNTANPKLYPSLTTTLPTFVTRGRYIKNPVYFNKNDQEMDFYEDPHAEFLLNGGMPKWNRFHNNHRQLNKYGPTPTEADITVDEDGSTGYGSTFDLAGGGGGTGYDSGNFRNPGWANGDMMGWYNDLIPQSSRPVPIIAEIRHPSNQKMSIDVSKIGMIALVKIGIAKLKALGFIKAMLLVLFKLKLLILVLVLKFLMLLKFVKLSMLLPALFSVLTLPMFLSRIMRLNNLLNQPVLVPNNNVQSDPVDNNINGGKRRSNLDAMEEMDPGINLIRKIIKTEKCVEKISCRMAGAKQPNSALIWLNWAASPITKYIPSRKIRTFISTFTTVINYRLDNLYNSLLPNDWPKWCDEHYACSDAQHKSA